MRAILKPITLCVFLSIPFIQKKNFKDNEVINYCIIISIQRVDRFFFQLKSKVENREQLGMWNIELF